MNPIANLPATQNLNRAQQSQGYNRQYFGGDEVDEVVLSNQDEQAKKKKMWTIGGAILGTLALVGGTLFGLNVYGKIGKDASYLSGFVRKTQQDGEKTINKVAIAKDTKWTGLTYGGLAETIKECFNKDAKNKFGKVVLVMSEEEKGKIFEKLGQDWIKEHGDNVILRTKDKLESLKDFVNEENTLIMTDAENYDNVNKIIDDSLNPPSDDNNSEEETVEKEKVEEDKPTDKPAQYTDNLAALSNGFYSKVAKNTLKRKEDKQTVSLNGQTKKFTAISNTQEQQTIRSILSDTVLTTLQTNDAIVLQDNDIMYMVTKNKKGNIQYYTLTN